MIAVASSSLRFKTLCTALKAKVTAPEAVPANVRVLVNVDTCPAADLDVADLTVANEIITIEIITEITIGNEVAAGNAITEGKTSTTTTVTSIAIQSPAGVGVVKRGHRGAAMMENVVAPEATKIENANDQDIENCVLKNIIAAELCHRRL